MAKGFKSAKVYPKNPGKQLCKPKKMIGHGRGPLSTIIPLPATVT